MHARLSRLQEGPTYTNVKADKLDKDAESARAVLEVAQRELKVKQAARDSGRVQHFKSR